MAMDGPQTMKEKKTSMTLLMRLILQMMLFPIHIAEYFNKLLNIYF